MIDSLEGFAERLREVRKQKNLSQTELGRLCKLHYTHIGRFERGLSSPSSETLRRLADALEVTSDFLLDGATEKLAMAKLQDRELLKQFQEVEHLSEEDKNVIKKLLEAFLLKRQLHALTR